MKRFFFDVVGSNASSYDYHGKTFHRPDDARELAENMALDLGSSETDNWSGFEVQVRDVVGAMLCAIPIFRSDAEPPPVPVPQAALIRR